MVKAISSKENPTVKQVAKLVSSRGQRKKENIFVCEGFVLLEEALRSGLAVQQVFCLEDRLEKLPAGLTCDVFAVTPGVLQRISDVEEAKKYWELTEEERDPSPILGSLEMFSKDAGCMYCNHCLPCPAKIDIAAVNKYLDLVELDKRPADSVKQHYLTLENGQKIATSDAFSDFLD